MKQYNASSGKRAVQLNVEFIRLKSYKGLHDSYSMSHTSCRFLDDYAEDEVQVLGISDLSTLKERNIIVIEDMVDTGASMKKLLNLLSKYDPNSVKGENHDSSLAPLP